MSSENRSSVFKNILWIAAAIILVVIIVFLVGQRATASDKQQETLEDILPAKLDCSTCSKKMNPTFLLPEDNSLCDENYSSLPCTELVGDIWRLKKDDCSGNDCGAYSGAYIYDKSNNKQCKKPKNYANKLEEISVQSGYLLKKQWRYKENHLQNEKGDTYSGPWKYERCGPADFTCSMVNGIDCNERVCKTNTNSCASETVGDLDGISFNEAGFMINDQ